MYLYLTGTLELPDAFDTHSLSKDFREFSRVGDKSSFQIM